MKFISFLFLVAAFAVYVGQMGVLAVDCSGTQCDPPCECRDTDVCVCPIA